MTDDGTLPSDLQGGSGNPCQRVARKPAPATPTDEWQDLDSQCEDGKSKALLTNVLIGVAVASGLAAGYFYYNGYMQADSGERAVAGRNKKASQPTVKLTPTVTPDYFGAGVKIEF